ncbi:MarR family winged helix-turn-helix transcriptional regulator [Kutzneria kofuensis]|uniref:DNA-binding MarR family transcriptional regulator n=1 Tax=Kutzneria kofuensis TaxID=103725 RepID=A0A7W9NFA0_9PSEU|nr:MarR family transcriptional regulator [Kutzneria kofuensis]MBB5889778.1 DNA-binding MarR family transcriptional regulator [Kutzneria kofuensis]
MTPTRGWLNEQQLATWIAFNRVLSRLPAALESQLQQDARVSYMEYHVLARLSDQPSRTCRMSALADLANSELSRLSHLVRRLEKRGLVRREPDPSDGRYTNAILTDAGQQLLVEIAPAHVDRVRDLVIDSVEDFAALERVCLRILDRITAR